MSDVIETVVVRPWPGLILDGIPPQGAAIPKALAEEWIADRLVVRAAPVSAPDKQERVKEPGATRSSKQGRARR